MKKFFKWTAIIVVTIIGGVAIVTATSQHKKYTAPYPAIKASKDVAVIERGKHLVFAIGIITNTCFFIWRNIFCINLFHW